jgi:hypothetical protein
MTDDYVVRSLLCVGSERIKVYNEVHRTFSVLQTFCSNRNATVRSLVRIFKVLHNSGVSNRDTL